jgi:hypothetical protein
MKTLAVASGVISQTLYLPPSQSSGGPSASAGVESGFAAFPNSLYVVKQGERLRVAATFYELPNIAVLVSDEADLLKLIKWILMRSPIMQLHSQVLDVL